MVIQTIVLPQVGDDPAVAAMEGSHKAVVGARVGEVGQGRGRGEARGGRTQLGEHEPVEEAEEGRGAVEGAVAAEEAGVADDPEPPLADEGGAEEVLGLVRREAEDDLDDGVVDQRRHGALVGGGARVWVGIGSVKMKAESLGAEQSERVGLRWTRTPAWADDLAHRALLSSHANAIFSYTLFTCRRHPCSRDNYHFFLIYFIVRKNGKSSQGIYIQP